MNPFRDSSVGCNISKSNYDKRNNKECRNDLLRGLQSFISIKKNVNEKASWESPIPHSGQKFSFTFRMLFMARLSKSVIHL